MRVRASLAAVLWLSACDDGCRNSIVSSAPAPDGRHAVAMFGRDCGATTGFSTQISVLGAGRASTDGGNAFIADRGSSPMASGGPWAEMAWLAPDRLLIRYDSRARLFKKVSSVDGVSISYQPVTR